jgi:hypothetical protein
MITGISKTRMKSGFSGGRQKNKFIFRKIGKI